MTRWRRILRVLVARWRDRWDGPACRVVVVHVKWPPHPNPKYHWPCQVSCWSGRRGHRTVHSRRGIAAVIGTNAFVWTGPREITVTTREN